jgi:hypothetical protein
LFAADSMLCHSYWEPAALAAAAAGFVRGLSPDDVAVIISAKSGTPLEIRREAMLCVQ